WWQRMKLLEQIVRPSDSFTGSCEDAAKGLMAQSRQWHEWVLNAQEHMLDHEFIYQNNKREKFKQSVYLVLTHIFNHGTYHRGQLVTILRQLEVGNIPGTDFILWSRKK
ncbi:MAG TPA: DinB family protein, partial [Flavisolibacter sp.]